MTSGDLIADLIPTYSGNGRMGRPTKWDKRDIVNAIFYVAATGCQWRALPPHYPHWNTVHRYHVRWSENGVWERVWERVCGTRCENVRVVTHNLGRGHRCPKCQRRLDGHQSHQGI
jgi:transposase